MENIFKIFLISSTLYLIFLGIKIHFFAKEKKFSVSVEVISSSSIAKYQETLDSLISEADQEKQKRVLSIEGFLWNDDFLVNVSDKENNVNFSIDETELGKITILARQQRVLYRRQVFSSQKEKTVKAFSFGDLSYG